MDTSSLMEQILSKDNLNKAYLQVVRNKGAEGVDGMKYTELNELVRGWINYFKIGSMKYLCREMDKHIRYRLRMCICKTVENSAE